MKWAYLIVILIVGGGVYYWLSMREAPTGTISATAEAFVKAALANDAQKVRALCVAQGVSSAEDVAAKIRASGAIAVNFGFQAMEVDPPRRGLTAMFSGRVLSLEMVQEGTTWKIIQASVAD